MIGDKALNSIIPENEEQASWLIVFADMMTLLLVFFILLYTLSSFETGKYKTAISKVKTQLKNNSELTAFAELMEMPETLDTQIIIEDVTGLRSRKENLVRDINKFADKGGKTNDIATHVLKGKIVVRVKGKALFKSSKAEINKEAFPMLDEIIKVLFDYPEYNINIKGHTDDIPISTNKFASNWELSAIRATNVLKHLIKRGVKPERLTATGYGKVFPLVSNDTEENRTINRRVEFVLEKKESLY
ncbi:MAG: OmpA family protein [Desulfobacteraceae bacterium]|nr:OmpA family protein [Desulfobacteraceae bacterium]